MMSLSIKRKAVTEGVINDNKKPKLNTSITSFFSKPKASQNIVGDQTSSPSSKFDKEAWVNSLTSDQKKLLKLEIETLHESWLKELKDDLLKPSFLGLKQFLQKEKADHKTVFPPESDIYSWFVKITNYMKYFSLLQIIQNN